MPTRPSSHCTGARRAPCSAIIPRSRAGPATEDASTHGAHVLIGTIFLAVCLFRAMKGHFSPQQHFGFEAAAWYLHFVDVVWLFLFICIYVIGAGKIVPH